MCWIFFLLVIVLCCGYQFKCPERAQWSVRAKSICNDSSTYFCVQDFILQGYTENCNKVDFERPGRRIVLRRNFDGEDCSSHLYQPKVIKFWTNVSSDCVYVRSRCSGIGQITVRNNDVHTDTSCRCDYTLEYDYVTKPRNVCACIPSEEDCSCYLRKCPGSSMFLSQDYDCYTDQSEQNEYKCSSLSTFGINVSDRQTKDNRNIKDIGTIPENLLQDSYKIEAGVVFIIMVLIIVSFAVFGCCSKQKCSSCCSEENSQLTNSNESAENNEEENFPSRQQSFEVTQCESIKADSQNYIFWKYFELCSNTFEMKNENENKLSTISLKEHPLRDIICAFSMQRYYPGKLSINDVHNKSFCEPTLASDVPIVMLKKILNTDLTFREKVLEDFLFDFKNEDASLLNQAELIRNNGTCDLTNVSPVDLFLSTLYCCDPILKEKVFQKVLKCQFAVPLIYRDYEIKENILSLWPLRGISIDTSYECIASRPMKSVTFIRVSNGLKKSKSKIINELLRRENEEHNTFFHRDCALGMNERKITNGLVEATWYMPDQHEKKPEQYGSTFPETFLITNLRGDANCFPEQIDQLLTFSNIVVVFIRYFHLKQEGINMKTLEKIYSSKCFVLVITDVTISEIEEDKFLEHYQEKIDHSKTKIISTFDFRKGKQMNVTELKKIINKEINYFLQKAENGFSLEKVNIRTDENELCLQMKTKTESLYNEMQKFSEQIQKRKEHFLPLQSPALWPKFCKLQRRKNDTNDSTGLSGIEMIMIREKQVKRCSESPNTLAKIVQVFVEFLNNPEAIQYFITFLGHKLNRDSRLSLQTLFQQSNVNMQDVENFEIDVRNATFGMEHIFREIGQIYEAFMFCKNELKKAILPNSFKIIKMLPVIAARLILLGQPFEHLDGDTRHVPIIWVTAVYNELKELLDNKTIFSISVLGNRGSGKTTLLNAIFDLRFHGSAGDFTKGIFAHLVPVNKLGFDYAMVIDTEGLTVTEIAKGTRMSNNAIATLVVGMGDVILLNIKGEAFCDLENFLRIAINYMTSFYQENEQISRHQKFIIVHQNYFADDAQKRLLNEYNLFFDDLLSKTKGEVIKTGIDFHFDNYLESSRDVFWLPTLRLSSGPMAPVNPTYGSNCVLILERMLKLGKKDTCIVDVRNNLKNLWKFVSDKSDL